MNRVVLCERGVDDSILDLDLSIFCYVQNQSQEQWGVSLICRA